MRENIKGFSKDWTLPAFEATKPVFVSLSIQTNHTYISVVTFQILVDSQYCHDLRECEYADG